MSLSALRVIHLHRATSLGSHDPEQQARALSADLNGAFVLETCQRRLWITTASRFAPVNLESLMGMDLHCGIEAYEFLLRVAAGLQSEVKGETEIFGQIKCAWQNYSTERPGDFKYLAPVIQRLFEDTKDVRSRYLQGFGGSSYGSMVRKILRGRARGPVLLAGAGQLAEAVLPYLKEFDVILWNRSEERIRALLERTRLEAGPRLQVLGPEAEIEAWRQAAHAVVCIPTSAQDDPRRIKAWNTGSFSQMTGRGLIHLGCTDHDLGAWRGLENFFPLKDLFEIRKNQDRARTEQIEKAILACRDLTNRRALELNGNAAPELESLALFA